MRDQNAVQLIAKIDGVISAGDQDCGCRCHALCLSQALGRVQGLQTVRPQGQRERVLIEGKSVQPEVDKAAKGRVSGNSGIQ